MTNSSVGVNDNIVGLKGLYRIGKDESLVMFGKLTGPNFMALLTAKFCT